MTSNLLIYIIILLMYYSTYWYISVKETIIINITFYHPQSEIPFG